MERTADSGSSDSFVTPAKASVVIYTPKKNQVLQDGPSGYLTPEPSRRRAAHENGRDPAHAQPSTLPGLQLRPTRSRRVPTSVREQKPRKEGTKRKLARESSGRNTNDGLDTSSDSDSPVKPPRRAFVSTDFSDIDPSSDSGGEIEGIESPSQNRRGINLKSFVSGSVGGGPSKGPKLSRERADQTRSEEPVSKSQVRAMVDLPVSRLTRSRVKIENLALTQKKCDEKGKERATTRIEPRRPDETLSMEERVIRDEEVPAGMLGKRLGEREDDDEDEDVVVSRKRRRTRFSGGLVGSVDRGEESDREDEDQNYARNTEVLEANRPRTRNYGGKIKPRMTRKQKLLEELKSRRAGLSSAKDAVLSSSSETLETPKRGIYDTETEDEIILLDDELDEESGTEAIRKSLRGGRNNVYDADFVVSDGEGEIGAPSYGPGRLDIPIQFTHHAHKKLKEHFSDAIEWMVLNKLNPAFDRKDPVYRIAFQRLDSEAATYSSSKFESSVWTQDFKRSVKARPEFYKESIISSNWDCGACNRKGHTATYKVQFSGKPYHHDSLEDITFSGDDDGDDDSENDYDSRGNSLPDVEKIYYVGRVCCLNAETAHALTHWRYHLNEWVVDELHRRGLFEPDAILTREPWNTKRRGVYANGIMKQLQQSGEIARLYRDFKNNLNRAGTAKPNQRGVE